jgi:hypothetical protein
MNGTLAAPRNGQLCPRIVMFVPVQRQSISDPPEIPVKGPWQPVD